jgi:hypothetical protein
MQKKSRESMRAAVAAFVKLYDESLEAAGVPRLTLDQSEVLRGMLDAITESGTPIEMSAEDRQKAAAFARRLFSE